MFVYNTSFHRSIKNSPFYLTFGVEPCQTGFKVPEMLGKFYGESSTDNLFESVKQARFCKKDATLQAQRQYDKKAKPHKYQKRPISAAQ